VACWAAVASTSPALDLAGRAAALARQGQRDDPALIEELITASGNDVSALGAARDHVARSLHGRSDDWDATATLLLLNRAISQAQRHDPMDWKERWARHRKP